MVEVGLAEYASRSRTHNITSTMAAVNISNYKNNFFSLFLPKKGLISRGALRKNFPPTNQTQISFHLALLIKKLTADQVFYDASTRIIPNS